MIPGRNSDLMVGVALALLCVTLVSAGIYTQASPWAPSIVALGTLAAMAAGWFLALGWKG